MSWWQWPILIGYFIVCILLMLIILIQSGKGGGLSSLGSAAGGIGDALGATSAEKTLNKITSGIAIAFMGLAIFLSVFGGHRSGGDASEIFGNEPAAGGAQAPLVPGAVDPAAPTPAAGEAPAPAASDPAADVPAATTEGPTNADGAAAPAAETAPVPAEPAPAAEAPAPAPEAPAQP